MAVYFVGESGAEYIARVFRQLIQGFFERLPSQCMVCHAWPASPVCDVCVSEFAQPSPRCTTCARLLTVDQPQCGTCVVAAPPLDVCLAAVPYAYPWSTLIADFKFRQHPGWAASFARLMRATPWVEPALDATHLLIPMPLSRQRLRERGYNQAHVLASALDASKVNNTILLRTKDTPPQRTLSRNERLRAVEHAFAVDPLKIHLVAHRRVMLIDDVMTSGASLHAAARALRGAGAAYVSALVLARTE